MGLYEGICHPTGLHEGISHPTGHYVRADHPGLHEGISHPTGHYVRADHPGLHEGISHPTGHYVRADHPGLHEGISHPTGHYKRADHPGLHEGISHPTGHYERADHPGLHEGISHPTGHYERADHPGLHEGISHPTGHFVRADHPGIHEGISHPTGHYVRADHPGLHEGISHPTGHYVRADHPGLREGISHPIGHYERADHPGLDEGISHPTGHYERADHPGLHEGISHPTGHFVRADHPGLHEGISHPTGHYVRADHPGLHEGISHPTGHYDRADHQGLHEGISHPTFPGVRPDNLDLFKEAAQSIQFGISTDLTDFKKKKDENSCINMQEYELAPLSKIVQGTAKHIVKPEVQSNDSQGAKGITQEVVLGNFTQSDDRFDIDSRGKQCTCNSVVFLCTAIISSNIGTKEIDAILYEGDRLYKELTSLLLETAGTSNEYLTFAELELMSPLSACNKQFSIDLINSSLCGSLETHTNHNAGIYSIMEAISVAMSFHSQALVMMGTYAMALLKTNNRFKLFDSHSHAKDGSFHSYSGTAAFITFDTQSDLVKFLQKNFRSSTQFEIQPVKVTLVTAIKPKKDVTLMNQCESIAKTSQSIPNIAPCIKHVKQVKETSKEKSEKYMHHFESFTNLQNYFQYQEEKQQEKNQTLETFITSNKQKHLSANSKLKNKKKREYMRKKRSDIAFRDREQLKDLQVKQMRRQNLKFRQKESEYRRLRRNLLEVRQRDKATNLIYMQNQRKNKKFTDSEKINKRTQRQLLHVRKKDRLATLKYKQNKRQNTEFKQTESHNRQIKRQLPDVAEKDRMTALLCKRNKRQNREFKQKESTEKRLQRQLLDVAEKDRLSSLTYKQKKRKNLEFKQSECKEKLLKRQLPDVREKNRVATLKYKQNKRKEAQFRQKECKKKRLQRQVAGVREKERKIELMCKTIKRRDEQFRQREAEAIRQKRKKLEYSVKVKQDKRICKKGQDLEDCIKKFHKIISLGPIFTCHICDQTWFKHSVTSLSDHMVQVASKILGQQMTHDAVIKRWICNTCKNSLNKCKVPKLSLANKCGFPSLVSELDLHTLEERLLALRIPFMQIRELPRGGQFCLKGNVVNVPVEINSTISSLPRNLDETQTVQVKLKRKLAYKSSVSVENVRPAKVLNALAWLIENSDLYKNVQLRNNWLLTEKNAGSITPEETDISSTENDAEHYNSDTDEDQFSEIDEKETLHNLDTLLSKEDFENNLEYTFAPGEGQRPLSIFQDPDSEYLSFPSIFCGKTRPENKERKVPVYYSDICKYELRSSDRRVAKSMANIFFKLKKVQLQQISGKVNLVMRKCQNKGRKVTAKDALNTDLLDNLVRLDEGYYIFRSLRNSPPYFESKKRELFAMIRQLGLPTWFMSLSSADSKWIDLLQILGKLVDNRNYTSEEIKNLDWSEKCRLVQSDPVTTSRYFNNRVHEFFKIVLKSECHPLGKITDHFIRVEFQHRGSPHVHVLLWVKSAPKYHQDDESEIIQFIDRHVSCSSSVPKDQAEYLEYQKHRHSKTCRKNGRAICRFGHPIPPMRQTCILTPLEGITATDEENFLKIKSKLQEFGQGENMTFDAFLENVLRMNEENYLRAVRSSITSPKVFLKRSTEEIRINSYMQSMIHAWGANHDLQFVLDPYACAVYIVSYVSKSQRGMSALMDRTCKEARNGNKDLKEQVRHIGNAFLNSVEVSAQEAAYLLLQMPLTSASREVVFINTSHPDERTFLLKSKDSLEKLPENSTDIQASNVIKRYCQRPKMLQKWCLADYVSLLNIDYPKDSNEDTFEQCSEDNKNLNDPESDICESDSDTSESAQTFKKIEFKSGMTITRRKTPRVIRYVRFNKENDPENFYRERLLLFLPWKNEILDLKKHHDTYRDAYFASRHIVDPKAQNYEKNAEVLQQAMKDAETANYDAFDELAPGTQQTEREDAAEGQVESENHSFFRPSIEQHSYCDIGIDLGLSSKTAEVEQHAIRLPEREYHQLIQTLNRKQLEIYTHIVKWIKTKNVENLHLFLTGGAGVGKSVVVTTLYQTLHRHLCGTEGENPEEIRILLCAYTGSAAFNIGGITIHKAFALNANQSFTKPLSADKLNTLRVKYRKLSVLIIDEISLVSNELFAIINQRLQQIKGNSKIFGGIHVIVVGDLFQLKPVMGNWIFQDLTKAYGALAPNLWHDHFKLFELTQIMRQKDDQQFAELLNRLRIGCHTKEDVDLLQQQVIAVNDIKYNALAQHFFRYRADVKLHNHNVFHKVNSEKTTVIAQDTIGGDTTRTVAESIKNKLKKADAHETLNLETELNLAVSLRYDVTINILVEDGLTNGTACILKKIQYLEVHNTVPSVLWVLFDNKKVGQQTRRKYFSYYNSDIDKDWTPIFAVSRPFTYNRHQVIRTQFPLTQSAAKTIHKSQGLTYDEIVVKTAPRKENHIHYVAFSRVRNLSGLQILDLNASKISVSGLVIEEMERLRTSASLKLCFSPIYELQEASLKCVFVNSRSFHKHYSDLNKNHLIRGADIIGIAESRLLCTDRNDQYTIEGYSIHRNDQIIQHPTRPPHGLVIYSNDNTVKLIAQKKYSSAKFEYTYQYIRYKKKCVQILVFYIAPNCDVASFKAHISRFQEALNIAEPFLLIGDMNIDAACSANISKISYIEQMLKCRQFMFEVTTDHGTILDHIYSNTHIIECGTIDNPWSDHKFVYASLGLEHTD